MRRHTNKVKNFFNQRKKLYFLLLICGILLVFFVTRHFIKNSAATTPQAAPITVAVASAQRQTWADELSAVGTVKAYHGIALSAEVSGKVTQIHFNSGDEVQAGQLLVELASEDLQATLDKNQAQLELAQANYQRYMKLAKDKFVSTADLDKMRADLHGASADVKHSTALVAQHQIKAPFAGKLGICQVDIGQYVTSGQTLVTLETLTPIFVDFNLPEKYSGRVHKGDTVHFLVNSDPSNILSGKIVAISPEVDADTRNLQLRAQTANTKETLLPGMFVNITLNLDRAHQVVTVPQTAIKYGPDGAAVYVVTQQKAHLQTIQTGQAQGNLISVTEGLKTGDVVVIAGQNKLSEGALVKVSQ